MSRPKKAGLSVRVISLALALVSLAVVLGFAVPEPVAAFNCGTEIYYYSDASLTVQIGEQSWSWPKCGCQLHSWGSTSPYSVTTLRDIC